MAPPPAKGPDCLQPRQSAKVELAIVGGGLAGGLIALALHRARPGWRMALVERERRLGGNHRWSWFESDLGEAGAQLMEGFAPHRWADGYEVAFPSHDRRLPTSYRSLDSAAFDAHLQQVLPGEALFLGEEAATIEAGTVTLSGGRRIEAEAVIDARGFAPSPHLAGGWQIFLGQHWRMDAPHGVKRPVIMEARIDQLAPDGNAGGAYRFLYLLPLSERELFIEDTYYADHPRLDRALVAARIAAFMKARGMGGAMLSEEAGLLPVLSGGDRAAHLAAIAPAGVGLAGTRALLFHPLTSYSLPQAVGAALELAAMPRISREAVLAALERHSSQEWRKTRFYRGLARMLFTAARPSRRVDIFDRFYRLPAPLIERFYAGRSTLADKARILIGKPPVPVARAIAALASSGTPLQKPRASLPASEQTQRMRERQS